MRRVFRHSGPLASGFPPACLTSRAVEAIGEARPSGTGSRTRRLSDETAPRSRHVLRARSPTSKGTNAMGRLEGKVAFITGAARSQGRSHAVTLAHEGADIIAIDIAAQIDTVPYPMGTPGDLAETVGEVEALGRRIVASEVDVRDYDALKAALDEGVAELGGLDIVAANAGLLEFGTAGENTQQARGGG